MSTYSYPTEVAGLNEILLPPSDFRLSPIGRATTVRVSDVTYSDTLQVNQFTPIDGTVPPFATMVVDGKSSNAGAENVSALITQLGDWTPFVHTIGIGYTDPTSTGGGGSGSERPEDGLLYPRGQG